MNSLTSRHDDRRDKAKPVLSFQSSHRGTAFTHSLFRQSQHRSLYTLITKFEDGIHDSTRANGIVDIDFGGPTKQHSKGVGGKHCIAVASPEPNGNEKRKRL